ncbi:MAG TPA: phosphoribosylamine--glycine ligase [Gemmatimonadales bacterium]
MKVLVVGGGGREHALCWALKRDAPATTLFAAPGNPGTATLATNLKIGATALDDIVRAAREHAIDACIVGPEAPLAAGLADRLTAAGVATFGPSAAAAQIEASKAFAKDVMAAAGVPTARSTTVHAFADAQTWIRAHPGPIVVKASGLAAGKGAVVCATSEEALATAQEFLGGKLGDAGKAVVIEDVLEGEELSVLALTDGEQIAILPPAQDHKRLGEGDTGPNTGGMGAYCPVGLTTAALLQRVRREVLAPTLAELQRRGAPYQGVLYAGLMVARDGTPNVLEFNCRFGDPETQAILPGLAPGVSQHLLDIARGTWRPATDVIAPQRAAVTTVLAAPGYPDKPELGGAIRLPRELGANVLVFHAGTERDTGGALRVRGGRVLNVTGLGPTVPAAAHTSIAACALVDFPGKQYRHDIAWREIRRAGAA